MVGSVEAFGNALFAGFERWGWEYVDDGPPRPSPDLAYEPRWEEPRAPDRVAGHVRLEQAKQEAKGKYKTAAVVALIGFLALGGEPAGALAFVGIAAGIFVWGWAGVNAATTQLAERERKWSAEVNRRRAVFERERSEWQQKVAAHDEAERRRCEEDDVWFPIRPANRDGRIDIFGGVPGGWAALLTTSGCSLLSQGNAVTILDFSDTGVSAALRAMAAAAGYPVKEVNLADGLEKIDVVSELDADGAQEVLGGALSSIGDERHEPRGLRSLDGDLLSIILRSIERPYSMAKIAAGVRLLLGRDKGIGGVLSESERREIVEEIDFVKSRGRAFERLSELSIELDLASAMGSSGETGADLSAEAGLQVYTTGGTAERKKELIEALMVHALAYRVGRAGRGSGDATVVIVGADAFTIRSLERISKRVTNAGVRLVCLFEHLRGDLHDLVGVGGSSTIFMQLSNNKEAAAASNFIGREHALKLNQVTLNVGVALSDSEGETSGWQSGDSETFTGMPTPFRKDRYFNVSRSFGTSYSDTWSKTKSIASSESEQRGIAIGRTYDLVLEPTELQGLPPTAFILVEPARGERRVVAGDCNPGIVLLDRVSSDYPELQPIA